jgi:hypothetical protein
MASPKRFFPGSELKKIGLDIPGGGFLGKGN